MNELRPGNLDEFAGQPQLVSDLRVLLQAAKKRGECPDHILFAGPPGLGKTTLAQIVATELGLPLISASAPGIQKSGDLLALLLSINTSSVIFVDEIHALDRKAEELLYSAMEDGHVDILMGENVNTRSVQFKLEPFTLIGATTQMGSLSAPLRDRFGFLGRLVPYTQEELTGIVQRSAKVLNIDLTAEGAHLIAGRSRGTPRVANRWLRRVRDWAEVHEQNTVTVEVARQSLDEFGIDELGLDQISRDILQTAIVHFGGGPVGLGTLASAVGEADITLEEVYEPHLIRCGLLMRTLRGRVVTANGWRHLGLEPAAAKETSDTNLFSSPVAEETKPTTS